MADPQPAHRNTGKEETVLKIEIGSMKRLVTLLMAALGILQVTLEAQAGPAVAINELMASNAAAKKDGQGQYDDWIEIYNAGATAVDLGGMYLTDDVNRPTQWQFSVSNPALTTIPPAGYLLVWADGDTQDAGLHASFKLSSQGESVALFASDGVTLIDSVDFPQLAADVSYGRYPDANEGWQYFGVSTPGLKNQEGYGGLVEEVMFSQPHGFFKEAIAVSFTCATPDAAIYYTLDASEPGVLSGKTRSGTLCTGPIPISKTTCLRAVAIKQGWRSSGVVTQTYLFIADVLQQSPTGAKPAAGWPEPVTGGGGSPWGGWGSSVQIIDYGIDPDVLNDARYKGLVGDALLAIPTISLVTPLPNLFNSGTGIYVNALQDGIEWERPVSVEMIYPDGDEGFQINAGLRIRGGYGRMGDNPKHAFRLFFRAEYGAAELRYPLFGDEGVDHFEKVDLRCENNYSWSFKGSQGDDNGSKNTMLREVFSRDLQGAAGQPYTRSRYYHLYLDGQYWGIYETQERAEARYAASYFGYTSEDYDVVKVDSGPGMPYTVTTTDGTMDAYNRLWSAAVKGFTTDAAYCGVQGLNADGSANPKAERLVDVDNLIDYMLCTFFVGDFDAPVTNFQQNNRPNNFYAIYNRTVPDGFKFFRHDSEHTLFNVNENRTGPYPCGSQAQYFNPQWLHQQLAANAEYRMRFSDRVYRHFFNEGPMTSEAAVRLLTSRKDTIDLAIIAESARWGDAKVSKPRTKDDDWLPQVRLLLNDYFPKRTANVLAQFKAKGWYPAVDAPSFNQHGGSVDTSFSLVMAAPKGDLYYSLDGGDPRLAGGALNPGAIRYTGPVTLTQSCHVKARARLGTDWSAAHEAIFVVGPVAEGLRISEIMYHPASQGDPNDPNTEYIELTNIGTETINLSLVRFTKGIDFTFPSIELAPGGCCLVVKHAAAFQARYGSGLPVAGQYSGSLANDGEKIEIVDALGRTLQVFMYDDAWYSATDGGGYSLTILDAANPDLLTWSQADAWQASTGLGGSPGVLDGH